MNRHDFGSDFANIPPEAQLSYPRTDGDAVAEFAVALGDALESEQNIIGLARHEPSHALPVDGSREPTIKLPDHKGTDEDLIAKLHAGLIPDEQWDRFVAADEPPRQLTRDEQIKHDKILHNIHRRLARRKR